MEEAQWRGEKAGDNITKGVVSLPLSYAVLLAQPFDSNGDVTHEFRSHPQRTARFCGSRRFR
jgi:hypothetical protein